MPSTKYSRGRPSRSPRTPRRSDSAQDGTGRLTDVEAVAAWPAIVASRCAQSATLRAKGPTWSSDDAYAMTPKRLTRPYDGFIPTTPEHAAGCRIEPPVSVPSEPRHWRAATAAAEPP